MNKDLDYYMSLPYEVVVERDENGEYFATIPDLPGCMATEPSEGEVRASIEEAKLGWLMATLESGVEIKEPPADRQYSGRILLRTSPEIHRFLVEEAKGYGLTLNTYLNILITQNRCLLDLESIEKKRAAG
ncbi:MAG: type II toxin-antitoxin system HicB family antitoxin [Actinobacteria bacterium]|nr:type II toxin-antitoxin system HicB family antitoxin [Actinomycetota bacterium]MBU1944259.1 type II toxin-antitoxin system HicB family antitoxin [Actinomycetota bacterium]MBU2688812.1 type II toxin-antitoxin system HicB family antitoxin [Actinomycetota bacterium]